MLRALKLEDWLAIIKYVELYSWSGLDADQGVALDGTYIYIPSQTAMKLSKWTKTGTKLYDVDARAGDGDVNHISDITYYNGKVYCPETDWSVGSRTLGRIYVFNASDLSFDTKHTILEADIPYTTDLSGIAYDPNHASFWILGGDARRLYKFNTSFVYQDRYVDLPFIGAPYYNGICFHPTDGRLYSITSSVVTEFAPISLYLNEDAHDLIPLRASNRTAPPHVSEKFNEGLAIDPDLIHMYIAQKHTAGNDPLGLFDYFP